MRIPLAFRRFYALVNLAGTLAWVFSLGLGGWVSAVLADFIGLAQPWRSFFFVGLLLMLASVSLPFANAGFVALAEVLPKRPPAPTEPPMSAGDRHARTAIHEVMTVLESQLEEVEAQMRAENIETFHPDWQGAWRDDRAALAASRKYDDAYRATEKAFQALGGRADWDECRAAIQAAHRELRAAL